MHLHVGRGEKVTRGRRVPSSRSTSGRGGGIPALVSRSTIGGYFWIARVLIISYFEVEEATR
jgi:hypothetical protein